MPVKMIIWLIDSRLLAIMLGRLRMSLAEAQSAYLELASTVFTPKHHKMNPARAYDKLKASGKYENDGLTDYIKKLLEGKGLPADELLKDSNLNSENCKVLVDFTSKCSKLNISDSSALHELRIRLQLL